MPEITKIKEDIYKINVDSNMYLILYDNRSKAALIDCGDREYNKYLKENISKIIDPKKVTDIFLTHLHYDHIGNIDIFINSEIFASMEEVEFFSKENFGTVLNSSILEMLKKNKNKLKSTEEGKDILKRLGIEIIKTPGHTAGSVCYYMKEKNILFTGDTYFGNDVVGRTDLPSSVPDSMERSLRILNGFINIKKEETEDFIICPGHDY